MNLSLTENLSEDFSSGNVRTQRTIRALYAALMRHARSPQLDAAFTQWAQCFSRVTDDRRWRTMLAKEAVVRKLAAPYGLSPDALDLKCFVFATHTFFAILTKLLAGMIVSRSAEWPLPPLEQWAALDDRKLAKVFLALEKGEPFRAAGVRNFIEEDSFAWYTRFFTPELGAGLKAVLARLALYDPATLGSAPAGTQDILRKLYHRLVSPRLRQALGEYYTPEWLASHVLNAADGGKFRGEPGRRLLDPTCGSGTFLLMAIHAIRANSASRSVEPGVLLRTICRNIVGFDLNPLAVLAARTNYLFALGPLLKARGDEPLEIPVHLADTVLLSPSADYGLFDYVVGNPPWIGWENLPEDYRRQTKHLWQAHGLFVHRGMDTILGKGKKDMSMLVTQVAADRYLKEGGALAFVITQAVFKMAGAAQGFRKFYTRGNVPLECLGVEDFSELQLFEGATNKTAVVLLRKGRPTSYPVHYTCWRKRPSRRHGSFDDETTLDEVVTRTERQSWIAEPCDPADPTSAWLTGSREVVNAVRKVLGHSQYRAHQGVNTGGANAIMWFEILRRNEDGTVLARNLIAKARRKVACAQVKLEARYLYPLLKGRDVAAWRATPSAHLLFVQDTGTRRGLAQSILAGTHVLQWLERHESHLRQRAAYQRYYHAERDPFWSMFDVGDYTIQPWKVVWPRIARRLEAAVISSVDGQFVLPQETFSYIGLADESEAHYLCGVLNSTPFRMAVSSFSQPGSKSFGTPGILDKTCIPQYDPANALHESIAAEAGRLSNGAKESADPVHPALDELCRRLWGITSSELRAIETACRES